MDYLVEYGDFSDQRWNEGGWDRKAAEEFVKVGYAPSMAMFGSKETGYTIKTPRDGLLAI